MVIDTTRTFKVTAKTPLGDEDFFISFINLGEVIGGRIWNDKGEIKFFDSRTGNNFLFWNIDIDVPFETKLQFRAIMDDEKNSLRGIVTIGNYGEIEFQGFGEQDVT